MIHGDGGHARVVKDCRIVPEDGWIIAVGDNKVRKFEASHYTHFATAIHPRAYVHNSARIGEGTVIMAGAVVQANAILGKHCIVNSGATVDHDCELEDFVHVAPGAHLCGNVYVGEGTLIGVGVGVAPNTTIPSWSIVKASRLEIVPV